MKISKKTPETTTPAIQQKEETISLPVQQTTSTMDEELERLKNILTIIQNQPLALWSIKENLELMNKRLKDMIKVYALVNNIELENED